MELDRASPHDDLIIPNLCSFSSERIPALRLLDDDRSQHSSRNPIIIRSDLPSVQIRSSSHPGPQSICKFSVSRNKFGQ